jgi:hypothetical protein
MLLMTLPYARLGWLVKRQKNRVTVIFASKGDKISLELFQIQKH